MLQRGKARCFFIMAETLYRSDVFFHHGGHAVLVRHGHRLFEQHLNEIGSAGLGAFFIVQVLLEYFVAHTCPSLSLMAFSNCLLTVSM